MSSHKAHHIYPEQQLIGNAEHKQFLTLLAAYGITQRGGVQFPALSELHNKHLVSDVNLLDLAEKRRLIFHETIISN